VKDTSFIGNFAVGLNVMTSENVTIDGAIVADNKKRDFNV
jgi:hypothetical protein